MALHITRPGILLTVAIIVVSVGLIGGLMWVKHAGEQARRAEAIAIAEERLKNESERDVSIRNEGAKDDDGKKAESDKKADDTNTNEQKDSTGEQGSGATVSDLPAGGAAELPQTGAGDAMSALGAGALTFAGVAYVASRRY